MKIVEAIFMLQIGILITFAFGAIRACSVN